MSGAGSAGDRYQPGCQPTTLEDGGYCDLTRDQHSTKQAQAHQNLLGSDRLLSSLPRFPK